MFDQKKTQSVAFILLCIAPVLVILLALRFSIAPPPNFPDTYRLHVEKGQTLFSISKELFDDHIIKSRRLFEIFMITLGSEKKVSQGEYFFEKPISSLEIALRISGKEFGINRKFVTFPEGFTNKEIGDRMTQTFPSFDHSYFDFLSEDKEGYLFPDTYAFFPSTTPEILVQTMSDNFNKQIEPLMSDIKKSSRSLKQIIIMASIIEKEASGASDMGMISGILWKRFDLGIALQVDAPFLYILDKTSVGIKASDLKIKSPYNTYLNKGLTPTPIGNPGLDAIKASIFPVTSPYFFYLHDKNANIHYAKTYSEHLKNIKTYLK